MSDDATEGGDNDNDGNGDVSIKMIKEAVKNYLADFFR